MKKLYFEWYVLNQDRNTKEIKKYNIFNNIHVLDGANELCVKYKRNKMTFDEFVEELRSIIMWQEWSRCEYEIAVGSWIGESELQRTDCYEQALPNMRIIAKYVLEEYYPRLKINLETEEIE